MDDRVYVLGETGGDIGEKEENIDSEEGTMGEMEGILVRLKDEA